MRKLLIHSVFACLALGWIPDVQAQEEVPDSIVEVPSVEVVQDTTYSPVTATDQPLYYFNEISDTPEISARVLDTSSVNQVRSDKAYWYANTAPKRKKTEQAPTTRVQDRSWFQTIFWILLIGGFVALLGWFLAASNIRLFRRAPKSMAGDEPPPGEPGENIFEMDFSREINRAIAAGNYRLAIRLSYLQVLRELAQRELIQYSHEKTNSDYLQQLSGTRIYKDFFRITRHFEYTWYGGFFLNREVYAQMEQDFINFKKQLG